MQFDKGVWGGDQAVAHDPSFHGSKMQAVIFLKLKINKKESQDQTSFYFLNI